MLDALETRKAEIDGSITLPPFVPIGDLRLVLDEHQRHHGPGVQDARLHVLMDETIRSSVDPMPNFQPMKDLVVHMDPFWDKYSRLKPYLQPADEDSDHERERRVSPEDMKKLVAVANCVMCATCYALCPVVSVDPAFAGPAAIAYAYRFIEDVRDSKRKERTAQISEDYLWLCAHCYACSYCPKHVDPHDRIIDVKRAAIEEGARSTSAARATRWSSRRRSKRPACCTRRKSFKARRQIQHQGVCSRSPVRHAARVWPAKSRPCSSNPFRRSTKIRTIFDTLEVPVLMS